MRTLKFNLLAILFLSVTGLTIAQDKFEKKFNESYDVDKSTLFEITNKFGDINIENTTANKITIDAEIIVKAKSQEKADKIMKEISVEISKSGNTVKAITDIGEIKSNHASFEINYHVKMPAFLNTNLVNKYGNVVANELLGKSNIAVKYGSLTVNKLIDNNEKPLSTIELGYCENSSINELGWAKVLIKYSKLKLGNGQALVLSSKYSKLRIGNFSSIVADAGYDDYNVGNTKNLVLIAKYSNIDVEEVSGKFKLENKYGNVSVDNIPDGFTSIDVVSKYASIDLGIATNANYTLDAKTSYADIKYENIEISQRIKEDHGHEIKGKSGSKTTDAYVKIVSNYGGVDLRP